MLEVGKVLKAHGIRGDIKIECYMDTPNSLRDVKIFYINEKKYIAEKVSIFGDFVLIKLNGIDDMSTAETLRGSVLRCEESDLPSLEEGRYYISDLIGCNVVDGQIDYGKIVDILQHGSADVIVVSKKGKRAMFPWIKGLDVKVDIETRLFRVDSKALSEVIFYEN